MRRRPTEVDLGRRRTAESLMRAEVPVVKKIISIFFRPVTFDMYKGMVIAPGRVLSVSVGTPREFEHGGRLTRSAIWKTPTAPSSESDGRSELPFSRFPSLVFPAGGLLSA
jgi:hypothetical protein